MMWFKKKQKPVVIAKSELYDTPQKLKVQQFYEIMKTGDLSLLKVNPELEADEEVLNNVWNDLREYFFSRTSKKSFDTFKRNLKNVVDIQNEVIACWAAFELVKFWSEDISGQGYALLKSYGINATDEQAIQSAINRKETKLEFAKNKLDDGNKKEEISFYKILEQIEDEKGRRLDIETYSLERWCDMLDVLKEKRELQRQLINEQKSKRHGR